VYFVSKVLQGPETGYQAIEKTALVVVFTARELCHYFQSLTVIVMTDMPIRKVLQKLDITGRMVRWVWSYLSLTYSSNLEGQSRVRYTVTSW